jgi:hypothetical protein
VLILKIVKVLCFDTPLQVLILSNLPALNCTKIVQNGGVIYKCGKQRGLALSAAPESKNASKVLALVGQNAIITGSNYTSGVKRLSRENRRKALKEMRRDLGWSARYIRRAYTATTGLRESGA